MMVNTEQIRNWVQECIGENGTFLVEIKLTPGKLMVFLENLEGLNIQECARISRFLNEKLEPTGFLETHDMEVSSPGIDQPFRVKEQYKKAEGRKLKVQLNNGEEITGMLMEAGPEQITLVQSLEKKENKKKVKEEIERKIPFSDIKETKLILSFK